MNTSTTNLNVLQQQQFKQQSEPHQRFERTVAPCFDHVLAIESLVAELELNTDTTVKKN